jgi:hypothetical protein
VSYSAHSLEGGPSLNKQSHLSKSNRPYFGGAKPVPSKLPRNQDVMPRKIFLVRIPTQRKRKAERSKETTSLIAPIHRHVVTSFGQRCLFGRQRPQPPPPAATPAGYGREPAPAAPSATPPPPAATPAGYGRESAPRSAVSDPTSAGSDASWL